MSAAPTYEEIRMPVPVPGRPSYIPEWTPRFTDEQLRQEVRHEGRPLGFTVASVLPDRRWAVRPDSGETIELKEFEEKYRLWKSRFINPANGQLASVGTLTSYFDATAIAVPNIVEFVDAKYDTFGKEVPIGYDADRPADRVAKPTLYTHDGEVAREVKVALAPSKVQAKLELLTEQFQAGDWTATEYAEKVAALTAGTVDGDAQSAAPEMPEGFDAVKETPTEEEPPKKLHWKTREKMEREARERGES